ncbi:MAG: radical SAM protein [Candidatus Lokiarchaeota archaeon]|nr:radical SAM protein [Candidatus Lokiarchaeota archaeon]MBD3201411.1 radical SAM protein [Candidatus Lokiarchaeota archaeon]
MRVLLVSVSREIVHVMTPPLGESYIASYLISEGHQVKILDLTNSNDSRNDIKNTIEMFEPDLIGISIRNIDSTTYPGNLFFYLPARNVISYIKQIAEPETPVVLGGAGFSIFSEEILKDLDHNLGVVGDGEYVFNEILNRIGKNEDPRKIDKGICYLDNDGNYHQNPPWRIEDLNELPIPARELIDNDSYLIDPLNKNGSTWGNIQTKRGCPKNCIYCSYKYIEGSNVRYRSPESVGEELEIMVNNYGIKNVFFVDSVFNLNYNHVKNICKEIINRELDINWGANYIPSKKFLDLMPLMKESGAIHLATGMESLSEEMLKNMKKDRTNEDSILTSKKCIELEIEQLIHMIIGGPNETLETVRVSLDLLETVKNYRGNIWQGDGDVLLFVGMRIYPHTELQILAEQEGVIPKGQNLLKPKFYISPKIKEVELFQVIREYCSKNPRWMAPGLGINNPDGFSEMSNLQFALYQT